MANIVAVLYVAFLIAGSAIGEVIAITYTGSTTSQTNAEATGYIYGGCYIRPNPSGINVALRKNIEGIIEIKQKSTGGEVEITLDLSGFNTNSHHGFHIHTYGYNDRGKGCSAAGGHYNPFSNVHGSPSDNERHVGDLGNIVSDENGNVKTVIRDSVVSLIEENSVIGRSFVVHAGTDDLGRGGTEASRTTGNAGARLACCTIGMIPKYIHAGCYLRPNPSLNSNDEIYRPIEGSIHVKQLTSGGDVEISLDVSGFDSRALHAFHVHSYGYIGDTGCDDTGGHYNPYGKWHGAPQDSERHVGDLGNIQSDDDGNVKIVMRDNVASLVGEDSIIGRSFVVHVGVDDLGRGGDEGSRTTGNAGPRLACCVIGHIPD